MAEEKKQVELILVLEQVRGQMFKFVEDKLAETNLPAYMMEPIIKDVLSDIQKAKQIELEKALEKTVKENADKK